MSDVAAGASRGSRCFRSAGGEQTGQRKDRIRVEAAEVTWRRKHLNDSDCRSSSNRSASEGWTIRYAACAREAYWVRATHYPITSRHASAPPRDLQAPPLRACLIIPWRSPTMTQFSLRSHRSPVSPSLLPSIIRNAVIVPTAGSLPACVDVDHQS